MPPTADATDADPTNAAQADAAQADAPRRAQSYGQASVISKKELKPFLRRSNAPGLINLAGHAAVIALTGWATLAAQGSWWLAPALLVHGVALSFLFAPMHECSHGAVFRTRTVNEVVYRVVAFLYLVPPIMFRYAHAAHHSHTNIRGADPDLVWPERPRLWHYAWFISGAPTWLGYLGWAWRHGVLGRLGPNEARYTPRSEHPRIVREARLWLLAMAVVWAAALLLGVAWELFLLWIAARIVGEPSQRLFRVAEHWERPETGDLRENTRTTRAGRILRFLFWNMSFHAEHHLAPLTPFHQLPKLHEAVKGRLGAIGESYPAVQADVLKAMRLRALEDNRR